MIGIVRSREDHSHGFEEDCMCEWCGEFRYQRHLVTHAPKLPMQRRLITSSGKRHSVAVGTSRNLYGYGLQRPADRTIDQRGITQTTENDKTRGNK